MTAKKDQRRSRVDDVLDLLDHATQRSGDASYGNDVPELCWRCLDRRGEGQAGVCGQCREILLDETYAAPSPRDGLIYDTEFRWPSGIDRITINRVDDAEVREAADEWRARYVRREGSDLRAAALCQPLDIIYEIGTTPNTMQRLDENGEPIGEPVPVGEFTFIFTPTFFCDDAP